MSLFKANTLSKGIMLMITGLIVAFFPGVISKMFYLIGIMIILFCAFRMVVSLIEGGSLSVTLINSFGVLIGAIVIFLPAVVKIGVPLITAIILGFAGVERLFIASELKNRGSSYAGKVVIGLLLITAAMVMFFHPFRTSNVIRIAIGLVIVAIGSCNLFMDLYNNKPQKNTIVDIENYSIREDDHFLE